MIRTSPTTLVMMIILKEKKQRRIKTQNYFHNLYQENSISNNETLTELDDIHFLE